MQELGSEPVDEIVRKAGYESDLRVRCFIHSGSLIGFRPGHSTRTRRVAIKAKHVGSRVSITRWGRFTNCC
jgi:hypothetical protein